jgi:hypothetical protein
MHEIPLYVESIDPASPTGAVMGQSGARDIHTPMSEGYGLCTKKLRDQE